MSLALLLSSTDMSIGGRLVMAFICCYLFTEISNKGAISATIYVCKQSLICGDQFLLGSVVPSNFDTCQISVGARR